MTEYKKKFMKLSLPRQKLEIKRIRRDLKVCTKRANRFDYLIENKRWLEITEEDIIKEFGEDFIEKPKKNSIFNFFKQKKISNYYV